MKKDEMKGPSLWTIPDGDNRERLVCQDCGYIAYENPKIVAGAVCVDGSGKFLLCKRAIEPRSGYWTIPAGFLELGESPEEGACREAMEEACAKLQIESLLAVYHVREISQIQMIFKAQLISDFKPGPESTEVALFKWDEIPWDHLAFPTVRWALHHYQEVKDIVEYSPRSNPARKEG